MREYYVENIVFAVDSNLVKEFVFFIFYNEESIMKNNNIAKALHTTQLSASAVQEYALAWRLISSIKILRVFALSPDDNDIRILNQNIKRLVINLQISGFNG